MTRGTHLVERAADRQEYFHAQDKQPAVTLQLRQSFLSLLFAPQRHIPVSVSGEDTSDGAVNILVQILKNPWC